MWKEIKKKIGYHHGMIHTITRRWTDEPKFVLFLWMYYVCAMYG